jgi:hypothetical protein
MAPIITLLKILRQAVSGTRAEKFTAFGLTQPHVLLNLTQGVRSQKRPERRNCFGPVGGTPDMIGVVVDCLRTKGAVVSPVL